MNGLRDPSTDMITPSTTTSESLHTAVDKDVLPLTHIGASMSAISFGFVATAILISMFLIMAIFEHLLRHQNQQRSSFLLPVNHSAGNNTGPAIRQKLTTVQRICDVSVVMPGHDYPTFIAQHAPLPCNREGICWPPHLSDVH
ncbi:hypothetical protein ZOSMA_117G00260 [Zostera marina]|uniref:Uncharacterized protein n=1 Tax=Zostera marina TaxID=29655 RepID=A0A0K9Q1T2_ZOSMR|nr:hypothetical protein ZOSMA_117G00260 [Zostera marina]